MVTDWIAIDTDRTAINRSHANIRLCFEAGQRVDSRDRLACPAAYEYAPSDHERAAIGHALTGADAVCILAGLGGRTGTHLAPHVAALARQAGALSVAVVTLPFAFEGGRNRIARVGLAQLQRQEVTDWHVALSNDIGLKFLRDGASVLDAYDATDRYVVETVMSRIRTIHDYAQPSTCGQTT